MKLKEYTLEVTTASNTGTATTPSPVYGRLYAVRVNQGTWADGAADGTLTYTNADGDSVTLLTLTNITADAVYYPRQQVHGNTGTVLTLDGTRIAYDLPVIAGKITLSIAQAVGAQTGNFIVYVLE